MVQAMMANMELNKILTNIAIGHIMKNGTTAQCWKQIRDYDVDFIAAFQGQATAPPQAAASTPPSPVLGPKPDPNMPPLDPWERLEESIKNLKIKHMLIYLKYLKYYKNIAEVFSLIPQFSFYHHRSFVS